MGIGQPGVEGEGGHLEGKAKEESPEGKAGDQEHAVGRQILEGLEAGETIVVLGVQRVRPGAEVTTRPVGSPAPTARPAVTRETPSRSSLNVPHAIGSAHAAERK